MLCLLNAKLELLRYTVQIYIVVHSAIMLLKWVPGLTICVSYNSFRSRCDLPYSFIGGKELRFVLANCLSGATFRLHPKSTETWPVVLLKD